MHLLLHLPFCLVAFTLQAPNQIFVCEQSLNDVYVIVKPKTC